MANSITNIISTAITIGTGTKTISNTETLPLTSSNYQAVGLTIDPKPLAQASGWTLLPSGSIATIRNLTVKNLSPAVVTASYQSGSQIVSYIYPSSSISIQPPKTFTDYYVTASAASADIEYIMSEVA